MVVFRKQTTPVSQGPRQKATIAPFWMRTTKPTEKSVSRIGLSKELLQFRRAIFDTGPRQ
jgi:hypothetical protein